MGTARKEVVKWATYLFLYPRAALGSRRGVRILQCWGASLQRKADSRLVLAIAWSELVTSPRQRRRTEQ